MSFNFQIISPQEIILNEDVELVIFPGIEGDFGILKNHMPFLTYLRVGLVYIYHKNNLDKSFLICIFLFCNTSKAAYRFFQ